MGRRLVAVLSAALVARDFAERRRLVNIDSDNEIGLDLTQRMPTRSRRKDAKIDLRDLELANAEVAEQLRAEQLRAISELPAEPEQSDRPCASHGSPESGCDWWMSGWTSKELFPQHLRFIMVFKRSVSDCVDVANEAKAAYGATDLKGFDKAWSKETQTSDLDDIIDVADGFPQTPTKDEIFEDDWVAMVQRQDSSSIIAYFRGNTLDFIGPYIAQVESNSKREHHIDGATSWGLSMLLHRLRLRGGAKAQLIDVSGNFTDGMVIKRGTNTLVTKGSLVYGSMMKEKRPYTFNTDKNNATYDYILNSEGYGAEYGSDEPC